MRKNKAKQSIFCWKANKLVDCWFPILVLAVVNSHYCFLGSLQIKYRVHKLYVQILIVGQTHKCFSNNLIFEKCSMSKKCCSVGICEIWGTKLVFAQFFTSTFKCRRLLSVLHLRSNSLAVDGKRLYT